MNEPVSLPEPPAKPERFAFDARIFEQWPGLVWILDLEGVPAYFNRAAREFLGADDPTQGRTAWIESVHPAEREAYATALREGLDAGAPFFQSLRRRNAAGEYRCLTEQYSPARDPESGRITGFVCFPAQPPLEARMTRIMDATTDYVGMATADGFPLYINAAGRKMLGISSDEPLDFHVTRSHPDWANEILLNEAIPTAIRDGYWSGENALLHQDGHEIPVSQVLLSHRGANGEVEFLSTIIRDLSDRKQEEIQRIEWANRYDAAIRASGQILFDWDSTTDEITYAGDAERHLGYEMAEMAGGMERLRSLIHPDDLEKFNQHLLQVCATRAPFHHEIRLRDKQQQYRHFEVKGYFFLDRKGRDGRMVGFLADVTSHRSSQEALSRAQETLEQRVEERTAELERVLAMLADRAQSQEAVAQLGQRALYGLPLTRLIDEAVHTVQSVLCVDRCALLALTRDGTEFVVRAQVGWPAEAIANRLPVGHGSQAGYTVLKREPIIVEDATQETRFAISGPVAEAGLMSGLTVLIEGADGPLGVLTAFSQAKRAFAPEDVHFVQSVANVLTAAIQRDRAEESIRQAREQAELASRAKTEFLSRMSHELRTPLNAILGFTQLLELENLGAAHAESLEHISRAGKHLLSLVNEVLDISRIDAGQFALTTEAVEVRAFLQAAAQQIRSLAEQHAVEILMEANADEIQSGVPLYLQADRQRLHQVIFNLLSNAVKYNRPNGKVTVSYHADGAKVRVYVSDTGYGIDPDKLARLFLPFERLGAESTDIAGSGIGLALSRGIVKALQGELNVESRPGEGSTFWVSLPRAESAATVAEQPPTEQKSTPPPKPPPTQRRTILYIEDQDLNLRLVERLLNPRPQYRLLTAMMGGAGLNLAREQVPDLILLDLNLPDMPGDQVLHKLKAAPLVEHIPVIMVSADATEERIGQLLRLGATGYLTKPFKLSEFLRTIEQALAARSRA